MQNNCENDCNVIQEYTLNNFYNDIDELIKLFEKFHGLNTKNYKNKKIIILKCPICSKEKEIIVSDSLFKENEELVTLQFLIGTVCDHSFFVLIDKNLNIRNYQI